MKIPALKVRTFEIHADRKRGEGLRIGVTRKSPRGVDKKEWVRLNYFDLWLPSLAPSTKLRTWVSKHDILENLDDWETFKDRYEKEITKTAGPRQQLILLAETAKRIPISIGCNCENERHCHRSILLRLIKRAGTRTFQNAKLSDT
jgi:uncharacterized protein YeaO (DUF488 family)